jgi:hypothetical protein
LARLGVAQIKYSSLRDSERGIAIMADYGEEKGSGAWARVPVGWITRNLEKFQARDDLVGLESTKRYNLAAWWTGFKPEKFWEISVL